MPRCPICNSELQDGETFRLEYYAPRNWWVFYHNTEVQERDFVLDPEDSDGRSWEIIRQKGWCARANVVISHPIPFQLRGTDWISF